MDRFESLQAFVNVVEHGGFAAAARAMGVSRSAVNRHVFNLEDRLGVQLLTRTTRKVTPTETGLAFYERGLAVLGDLETAELHASQADREARGTLKINAPMTFGTLHLGRVVSDFMARYPGLRIELTLSDRFTDPVEDGADVTIRIAELPETEDRNIRRLAPSRGVVCASPDYIAAHGEPQIPGDLKDHACLTYGYLASGNVWHLEGPDGRHEVRVNGTLCTNNGEVLRDAALAGRGIASLPTFIVGADLQSGTLRTVLDGYSLPRRSIFVLYPPGRYLAAKVRLFTEFLCERFEERPYWDLVG